MNWTKEHIKIIENNYGKIPASIIAKMIGDNCTKNMIIGKANRLGLNICKDDDLNSVGIRISKMLEIKRKNIF